MDFTIDEIRLPTSRGVRVNSAPPRLPRHKQGDKFLKGPVPWVWLAKAMALSGKALHVGVALWFYAGMRCSPEVPFSLSRMAALGVNRFAASRGLRALEEAGLVGVVRCAGRKVLVTILSGSEATP